MEQNSYITGQGPSAWPLVFASIAMTVITFSLFFLYATIHWGIIPQTIRLQISVREIRSAPAETLNPIALDSKGKDRFDEMDKQIQAIKKTGISIMGISGLYPVTGLASLVFSIMAFFRKPRWAALIALPFGLLGLLMMGVMT